MGTGESAAKDRRSLEHSAFARKWKEQIKSSYKMYQHLMFCCYGPKFQSEASSCKACVQLLLDASTAVHSNKDHKAFKDAVEGELSGYGAPM